MHIRGARGHERPKGPVLFNRVSWQARDLFLWVPMQLGFAREMVRNKPMRVVNLGLTTHSMATDLSILALTNFTVSFWVRTYGTDRTTRWIGTDQGGVFCSSRDGSDASAFWGFGNPGYQRMEPTRTFIGNVAGVNQQDFAHSSPAIQDQWVLVTLTRTLASLSLYQNGRLFAGPSAQTGAALTSGSNTYGLVIGGQEAGSGGSRGGLRADIADFRMLTRAYTAAEVWALYDPATRWDLYGAFERDVFFDIGAAAVVAAAALPFRTTVGALRL